MKVSILAPIASSLYSRVVTWLLCQEPGIEVGPVIVRSPWSLRRMRSEWRRDGARLIRKIAHKMVLRDDRFGANQPDTLLEVARQSQLPGASLRDVTERNGISLEVVDDHNSPRAMALLADAAPDVIVFTGGGLLRDGVLAIPRMGILNCHMGILPRFRGMDVVEWTALEGAIANPGIGLTVHFMDSGVDTGPILSRQRTLLMRHDDFSSIRRRMERDMATEMVKCVLALRDNLVQPEPQRPADGRQYFVMHPHLMEIARRKLPLQLASVSG